MENFVKDLPHNLKDIAEKGNITSAEEALLSHKSKLLQEGCDENDIRLLKQAAAKIIAQSTVSASALLKTPWSLKWSRITLGCPGLDRCMRGGVVTRGITEFCGSAGVGKTQLLLQLSLTVQLPVSLGGLGKGVAFICTENTFPSKRLFQMTKSFAQRFPEQQINYLGNVHIEHVLESGDLLKCVEERLSRLMEGVNIGLIIIDSVAAIFRLYSNYIQRAKDMRKMVNNLLRYADNYNCAVICVNQVSTISDTEREVPCLGLVWKHLGRTRIKVSKVPKEININKKKFIIRKFEVLYSPDTPNEFAEFIITEKGVVDLP